MDYLYSMETVAVKRAALYDPLAISRIMSDAFSEAGLSLPDKARVLIKPNVVSQNSPQQCTTTHPAVIDALCLLLSDRGCRITIGDSSAYYQGGYTRIGFKTTGLEGVAKKYSARLIPFEEDGGILRNPPDPEVLKDILVTRQTLEADCLISVSKLKTHIFAGMTATVKNLFGLIPGGAKYEYHFVQEDTQELFGEKIADLYGLVNPDLFILDAVRGLEGPGPASTGKPKQTGLIMLSDNGYALDYTAARIIGLDPEHNEILQAGIRRGFLKEPEKIVLKGDFHSLPSIPYKLPEKSKPQGREKSSLYKLVSVHPRIIEKRCTGCGLCVEKCPLSAIRKDGGKPEIDPKVCLRCLYCYYQCPEKAIKLESLNPVLNRLGRILRRVLRI